MCRRCEDHVCTFSINFICSGYLDLCVKFWSSLNIATFAKSMTMHEKLEVLPKNRTSPNANVNKSEEDCPKRSSPTPKQLTRGRCGETVGVVARRLLPLEEAVSTPRSPVAERMCSNRPATSKTQRLCQTQRTR